MKITIKHLETADRDNPLARDVRFDGSRGNAAAIAALRKAGAFRTVAILDADNLDEAFARTNSIDRPWTENEAAALADAVKAAGGCRSTSVGDILETETAAFMVDPVGFTKLHVSR